jgi:uncharacterized membrane protein
MHLIEKIIIASGCAVSLISIWFIPKKKAAPASFIFMLTQFFTWILGLFVVEFALLDYPVRELSRSNATSFTFEFIILPIMTIHFVLHYPFDKPFKSRILYYFTFISVFTLIEYLLEKYTLVIQYHSWRWYWTWISMSLLFYIVMVIYRWFYKTKRIFSI